MPARCRKNHRSAISVVNGVVGGVVKEERREKSEKSSKQGNSEHPEGRKERTNERTKGERDEVLEDSVVFSHDETTQS